MSVASERKVQRNPISRSDNVGTSEAVVPLADGSRLRPCENVDLEELATSVDTDDHLKV